MSTLSRLLPPQRALAYGLAPKHATSPKDLGAYSPREILMRKPISAHEFLLPCTCFGFASLTNTGNKSPPKLVKPRSGLKREAHHQGNQRPLPSIAKLSPALASKEFFLSLTSICRPSSGFFLPCASWTACASKGGPSSTATREPLPL